MKENKKICPVCGNEFDTRSTTDLLMYMTHLLEHIAKAVAKEEHKEGET